MVTLRPIDLMRERINRSKEDSDTSLFHCLLYAGEFVLRLTTSAIVAAIDDDRDRHQYRLLYSLVRADGIGEWSQALYDAHTGAASQHLVRAAQEDCRILTERLGPGNWQYEAIRLLMEVQRAIKPDNQQKPGKVALHEWFTQFVALRNKTRAHGAPTPALCSSVSPHLMESIQLVLDNNPLFRRSWAHFHRNLSGKYTVVTLGGDESAFAHMRATTKDPQEQYLSGVYVNFDMPRRVELIYTDANVSDFFFPNGAFNDKHEKFELHSLITDDRRENDASTYMQSPIEFPDSETHGIGELEVMHNDNVLSNLPSAPRGYIRRPGFEADIIKVLTNKRHPVVTLVGRGGIGKTSLALQILHDDELSKRFDVILWFSARDIDLFPEGPKNVRPQVLTVKNISSKFVTLMGYKSGTRSGETPAEVMADNLRNDKPGEPALLFVFDNFDTIKKPVDLFKWLDVNIRLPNKILITSRHRDFIADYPIEIRGMGEAEASELISQTAATLGISDLITSAYRKQILEDADGHPYVIKILLGEVADKRILEKPHQNLARKDDVLNALFERTFDNLSPLAIRLFLTLGGWRRSLVPRLVLEAIVLRGQNERLDARGAIEELIRMSLIQQTTLGSEGLELLDIPIAAALFGDKKRSASSQILEIDKDIRLLRDLGYPRIYPAQDGFHKQIEIFFQKNLSRISNGHLDLADIQHTFDYIARSYPRAWLFLAEHHENLANFAKNRAKSDDVKSSIRYYQKYVENIPDGELKLSTWKKLVTLYRRSGDLLGACSAFVHTFDTFVRTYDSRDATLLEIRAMMDWLTTSLTLPDGMNAIEKRDVFGVVAGLIEREVKEASASDLRLLAQLHSLAGNVKRSRHFKAALEKNRTKN